MAPPKRSPDELALMATLALGGALITAGLFLWRLHSTLGENDVAKDQPLALVALDPLVLFFGALGIGIGATVAFASGFLVPMGWTKQAAGITFLVVACFLYTATPTLGVKAVPLSWFIAPACCLTLRFVIAWLPSTA